jgi:hypothetical protein
MATITIDVPNPKATRVYNAFKAAFGHDVADPSAQEKTAFVKSQLVKFIRNTVHAYDVKFYIDTNTPAQDDGVAS